MMAIMLEKAKASQPLGMTDQGTRKARRLYVGNLPAGQITEKMLVDFFEAAVQQAGFTLPGVPGQVVCSAWVSTDDDRRFAFVEFRSMEECANALGLNGINFLGESLRISRPSDYDDAVRSMTAQGIALPQPSMPAMGMPAAVQPPAMPTVTETVPITAAIKLQNMVSDEDLSNPSDLEDIKEDVKDECSNHGEVKQVDIPGAGQPGCGSVFVLFGSTADAVKAQSVMHGRMFDGKAIQATHYSVEKIMAKQFA